MKKHLLLSAHFAGTGNFCQGRLRVAQKPDTANIIAHYKFSYLHVRDTTNPVGHPYPEKHDAAGG